MAYPLPIAQDPEIKRVQEYYARHHGITVPYDEAKRLLEGVMQFVYLTQIEDKLKDLKAELADSQNEELSD